MTAIVHEHSASLPAPVARVFAALTDADQLRRWFAEHVEVEPRRGGAYRFWGRHSYATTTRDRATQVLREFAPPERIVYDWRIDGIDTTVTLTLAPDAKDDGEHTRISVRHELAATPDTPRAKHLVDDLWRMIFGNLMAHLGDLPLARVDFTDPTPVVRQSVMIAAPRERAFRALLDPAILEKWIAGKATVEPRVGGRYDLGWKYEIEGREVIGGPTKILELVENEKLVTDWGEWRGLTGLRPQTITWLFESVGDATRVTLVHEGFERAMDISDFGPGWAWFLSQLKATSESVA